MSKHRRKLRKIRWGRVLLLPILTVIVFSSWMFVQSTYDKNELKKIQTATADYVKQLDDYKNLHKNNELIKMVIEEADQLAVHFDYQGALAVLDKYPEIKAETAIKDKTALFQNEMNALVPFTAQVRHLFFHDLIVYPKIAFGPNSHDVAGYDSWNITTDEFKGIIDQMYAKGYILVDFYDVYEIKNGQVTRKELKLPKGKIPFILSVDDVAFPDPKPVDGFAKGMTVQDNQIYTRVLVNGVEQLTNDGDVVPILEGFIAQHPDFSYKKARGILALSGYAGTFGYRLENAKEIQSAKDLAAALKAKGWIFACHSYGHQGGVYYSAGSVPAKITEDLTLWENRFKTIVGDTPLFVAPFGFKLTGASLQVVKDFGYAAYFIIDRRGDSLVRDGMTFLARVDIDGVSMRKDEAYLTQHFFDVRSILDINRP
jgi:hypothetical protein